MTSNEDAIRKLEGELDELGKAEHRHDQKFSDLRRSRTLTDLDRFNYHGGNALILKKKLAIIEAMRAVDPSYDPVRVARGIEYHREEMQKAEEARDRYRP